MAPFLPFRRELKVYSKLQVQQIDSDARHVATTHIQAIVFAATAALVITDG
jgi:hypothetical protein